MVSLLTPVTLPTSPHFSLFRYSARKMPVERLGVDALLLELVNEVEVFLKEEVAGDAERLLVGHADAFLELGLDAGLLEQIVELRARTVHDDGVEADGVEEGQAGAQLVEVVGEDGAADLDDGESLRRHRCEEGEVLLDLALGPDARECLHDHAARGEVGGGSGSGHRERTTGIGGGDRGQAGSRHSSEGSTGPRPEGNRAGGYHGGRWAVVLVSCVRWQS